MSRDAHWSWRIATVRQAFPLWFQVVAMVSYGTIPAIGEVTFGKNVTVWKALSTKGVGLLDYRWRYARTDSQGLHAMLRASLPMMPEYGMGFWQCKLRYQTQDELLKVAREYKRRGLPIDVIVVDFFHWPLQGDWKFDPAILA